MEKEIMNDEQLDEVAGGKSSSKKHNSAKCPCCVGSGASATLYEYKGVLVCAKGHVFPKIKHPSAEMLVRTDPEFAKEALKHAKK